MMKFFNKKIFVGLLFLAFNFIKAGGDVPEEPCGFEGFPPCDNPTSPIDMYVYILTAIAVLGIAYFAKKYKTLKA